MAVSAKHDEFNHWWATEGDWVEEPNYRRNGMSGVQCVERNGKKLYVKRMTHHLFHSVRYPFGRPTIVREVAVIKELERAGVIVPKIVFGEAVKVEGEWRALLVTEDMAGFISIADWYARHAVSPYSDEVRQAMLKAVALAFKKMHSVNRQHGCCYVRHIYVKTEGKAEAGFLDLEKRRPPAGKISGADPQSGLGAGESILLRYVIVVGQIIRVSVVSGVKTNSHLDFNIAFCPATTGQNFPRLNKS